MKSEVKERKSEVKERKSEVKERKSEVKERKSEVKDWIVEDQAILRSCDSAPRTPPSSPLSRQQIVSLSQSSSVSLIQLTDGKGGGRAAESKG